LIVGLIVVGWPFESRVLTAGFLLVLFGIVFLHELGHGIVARRFGLQVVDVTLWPLGGMTRMSRIPEDSKVEGWIAFAGPAVNLGLAALALPFAPDGTLRAALHATPIQGENPWTTTASVFVLANLMLAVFNLLPAFPLDGGRVLRALLALRTDWVSATRRTASVGKWIALALIFYGVFALMSPEGGSWFVPLFGAFLWWSSVRENWTVRMRHVGEEFARSMGVPFAEPRAATTPPPSAAAASASSADDDPSGARRPSILRVPETGSERLSDEQVAALERFRGRIGRANSQE
jgi:Zn-dependent protease